jgi:hypothetical protein
MRALRASHLGVAAVAIAAASTVSPARPSAQPGASAAVAVDGDDIGGVVAGPGGPEAGVWVVAETTELPTRYAKIVVTDDQGRYLLPDLPPANYDVWVRGYGLVDSPKVRSAPGRTLDLTATVAPDAGAAAQYYPAIYWYSMLRIPDQSRFGGKGDIPERHHPDRLAQAGEERRLHRLPPAGAGLDAHDPEGVRRVRLARGGLDPPRPVGTVGRADVNQLAGAFGGAPFRYYADWTDRIARGELPHARPERPEGLERNVVVTSWEWHTGKQYLHDLIASDRRDPTVNAYGPLFGSPEYSTDVMPILDPRTHEVTTFRMPVRDPDTPEALGPGHAAGAEPLQPSAYWGDEKIWDTRANNHNAMFDKKGRVWLAATLRGTDNPDFCRKGSDHPSARAFPLDRSARQVTILDPGTMGYTFVDTCFGTHHLQFGYDADDTLWLSGTGPVAGWVNTRTFDETGDAARSQGWSPFVLDANGNGRRDGHVEPGQPAEPGKDRRIAPGSGPYAVMPSPVDGSVWYTVGVFGGTPGVLRFAPGPDPTATGLAEVYNVPQPGYGIRGGDIDKDGVVWASLSSGHLASFDRRKCEGPLNGPAATGDHCPKAGRCTSTRGRASRDSGRTAPSRATTRGSTSTTRSAWARTSRCRRRT